MANNNSGAALRYEEVAAYLLNKFADAFDLSRVEGKQKVVGQISTTTWTLDAKGFTEGDAAFIIVECRRYLDSRLSQEDVAAIAFRIMDTGAAGAITVSPLDLQSGAKLVANATNISHVRLSPDSSPEEFSMQFLDQLFLGIREIVEATDVSDAVVNRAVGVVEMANATDSCDALVIRAGFAGNQ